MSTATPAGAPPAPTRVLLVDDQALIRAGFAAIISTEPDLQVVGEAATGDDGVRLARELRPDVVLMDIRMPGLDGIAATEHITGDPDLARVRVLVLTTFEMDETVLSALRAGAAGFLGKDVGPSGLLHGIRTVAAGEALLSPVATRTLVEHYLAVPSGSAGAVDRRLEVLTEREREVVVLVARGLSNDEIATELFVSPHTAKTHVSRAMTKLAARDRAQLVVLAYQSGLVRAGD